MYGGGRSRLASCAAGRRVGGAEKVVGIGVIAALSFEDALLVLRSDVQDGVCIFVLLLFSFSFERIDDIIVPDNDDDFDVIFVGIRSGEWSKYELDSMIKGILGRGQVNKVGNIGDTSGLNFQSGGLVFCDCIWIRWPSA